MIFRANFHRFNYCCKIKILLAISYITKTWDLTCVTLYISNNPESISQWLCSSVQWQSKTEQRSQKRPAWRNSPSRSTCWFAWTVCLQNCPEKVYNKLWILFQPQSLKEDSKLNLNVANNNDTIFILLLFACNAGQLYPAAFVAKNANGLTYAWKRKRFWLLGQLAKNAYNLWLCEAYSWWILISKCSYSGLKILHAITKQGLRPENKESVT